MSNIEKDHKNSIKNLYLLEIAVFVCGAVVMIYELAGSRVIAPYLGTSTYIWTSLIGVILGSLSLGYYLGGKLADRRSSMAYLSYIILASALSIIITFLFRNYILTYIPRLSLRPEIKALLASVFLFLPASFLLGMVSPYAVRLKITDLSRTGATVGNLYALSTTGSIIGTFLAGFYLIPNFGTTNIIYLLALVLVLTGAILLLGQRSKTGILLLLAVFIFLSASYGAEAKFTSNKKIDIDTEYNRIWIFHAIDPVSKKSVVALSTDPYSTQSAMFLDDHDLVFEYTKFYRLAGYFVPDIKKSLMIGGCGYSYPKDFLKKFPSAAMDVVEIDPKITVLAKKYFNLKDDPRMNIYHEDGRVFLNEAKGKYDVIFGDAFNSFATIPFQLATVETVKEKYALLNDNGAVILNIISAIEGDKGEFLRAEYSTYRSVFPQVYILPVNKDSDPKQSQNIILVALKSDQKPDFKSSNQEYSQYLGNLWKKNIGNDMPILTDDYAPVDYYKSKTLL